MAGLSPQAAMTSSMSSARRTWLASDRSVCSHAATVPLGRWCSSTRLHGRRSVRRTPSTYAARAGDPPQERQPLGGEGDVPLGADRLVDGVGAGDVVGEPAGGLRPPARGLLV